MKLDQMYPKKFATGDDLTKPATLTITRVTSETMHVSANAPAVTKFVVWFNGATKGVILSRTLAGQIAEALGSEETDDWIGKRVTLYPQPMTVAGQARVAIRAHKAANGETPVPPTLHDDDDDPAS